VCDVQQAHERECPDEQLGPHHYRQFKPPAFEAFSFLALFLKSWVSY
jgi:hypothetical protein